jgi:diguanylate cyclase (GGDEF)-like protein/PAS domain S-box-containing protein
MRQTRPTPSSTLARPTIAAPANPARPGQAASTLTASLLGLIERSAGAGTWTLAADSDKLQCSAGLRRLLGLAPKAALPHTLSGLLALLQPESRAAMQTALSACRDEAAPFELELQLIAAPRRAQWVRASGQALAAAAGQRAELQGIFIDLTASKKTAQQSQRVLMHLSTTLASINEAFATLDREGRFTYINPATERLLKCPGPQLLGQAIWHLLSEQDRPPLQQAVGAALRSGQNLESVEVCLPPQRWLELRAYPFAEGLAVYLRDVTERRRVQAQLELLQTSISRLNDIVLIAEVNPADQTLRIVFVNDAFERQTGYSQAEVLGRTPALLLGPLSQKPQVNRIRRALLHGLPVRAELINYKKNGEQFWMELEMVPVDHRDRGPAHWVAVGRDVTARKAADDEIEHLAFYDTLTGLPNRQLLMERLDNALSKPAQAHRLGALMFIDLDHFKVLNDTLGHAKGDMLLQQAAKRLQACVRRSDTVARLGGDEFVVMLEDLSTQPAQALHKSRLVSDKILAALAQPYKLDGLSYHGSCSIGITQFGAQAEGLGSVLKQADLAMYQAKAVGRNTACFFDPEMQAAASAHAALASGLRQALHAQQFVLHYQPQVGSHGQMTGVEALLRWQRPDRLLMPDEFISQAEESGLILPLGAWVLETACAQLARWAAHPATARLSMAVNVSARQFRHPEFVDLVMAVIWRQGIEASLLKLELTESLLASDIEVTIAKMVMLKDAGVTLSIDDFGMGFSALSYLKRMPLDQLKIDRAFVKDVLTDPNDAAIARTIIALGQSLGLAVMAEGVETQAQRDFLTRHGCDCYQGFLFCKPLPIDALQAFMALDALG